MENPTAEHGIPAVENVLSRHPLSTPEQQNSSIQSNHHVQTPPSPSLSPLKTENGLFKAKLSVEELRKELQEFSSKVESEKTLNPKLFSIIEEVATTGVTCYPWNLLCDLILFLLRKVVTEYEARHPVEDLTQIQKLHTSIISRLVAFKEPPFTLQRICELLLNGQKTYSSLEKYLFAFEKMATVSGTISVLQPDEYQVVVKELHDSFFNFNKKKVNLPPPPPPATISLTVPLSLTTAAVTTPTSETATKPTAMELG
eukprot:TRINITY_DN1964_c0_g2_i2.p1 TRINITY_DN1964_c0_g2~~TRINITY_DN1964_c0_g2_i2.p1  ORF type:complete len:274 (-),score=72.69 TRINITY_DN1964_c0_g2_i2:1267-2037(-)